MNNCYCLLKARRAEFMQIQSKGKISASELVLEELHSFHVNHVHTLKEQNRWWWWWLRSYASADTVFIVWLGVFILFFFKKNLSVPSVYCDRFTHLSWEGFHSQFKRSRRQVTTMAAALYLWNMNAVNLTSLDMWASSLM